MPHIVFVPFIGFRVREDEMRELGMSLPGFKQRAAAIAELPALGLLTLAGMLPESWTCRYHGAPSANEGVIEQILAEQPDLVAVSALTASIEEAYRFCQRVREAGVPVAMGGLHATVCAEEASSYCDAVVMGEGEAVWRELLADAALGPLRPIYLAGRGQADPALAIAPV